MSPKELFAWWWNDTRHPMGLLFLVYALVAGAQYGYAATLIPFFTAILVAGVVDLLIIRFQKGGWAFPSSGLVTGSIVGLVLSYQTALWLVAAVALIAILSKVVIAWHGKHYFNPANFGILLGTYLLGTHATWWGVSGGALGPIGLLVIILGGIFVVTRMRRGWIVIPFLLAYFGIRAALSPGDVLAEFLNSSALFFFATIMVIEPKTSPLRRIPQLAYGLLAGVLVALFSAVVHFGDFNVALAIANASVPLWNKLFK
jgi:Na+-translocating ferredoxin:NAD+ oxidoreductase RnfD subunit